MKKMKQVKNKIKFAYEVRISTEYSSCVVESLNDKFVEWFTTQKEAIKYARSIKKELKEICKEKARKDDIFCLDVIQYYFNEEDDGYLYEDMCGIVYSLNLYGKY